MKLKRIFLRSTGLLFILTALAGLTFLSGWLWSFRGQVIGVPAAATLDPAADVQPGETVTAKAVFTLPHSCRITDLQAEAGAPAILTAPPKVTVLKRRWSSRDVELSLPLAALRPGETKPGKITFSVRRSFGRPPEKNSFTVTVPAFMAVTKLLPREGVPLELADEMPLPEKSFFRRHWKACTAAAAALILLAAAAFLLLRRRALHPRQVPPWERALEELRELRFLVMQKRLAPETGIVQLTDLVRLYLEKRYGLPVTTETTREFLASLDRDRSDRLLPAAPKPFLREFLQSADLVRFARADADREMVDRAIAQAEHLVESSIPDEEESRRFQ